MDNNSKAMKGIRKNALDKATTGYVGRRAGPAVTNCSTQENGPHTSPGQNRRAGPGAVSADELVPRRESRKTGPYALGPAAEGELARAVLKSSPWW